MKANPLNSEVLQADEPIVRVTASDIEMLNRKALANERKRIRLCAHSGIDDSLHEMLIVHGREAYVRPHKHPGKTESVHIIEGTVDVIVFDDEGRIREIIRMGEIGSGLHFYYRMSKPIFHTLLIRSDVLVFHETTNGPFRRSDTVFAPWAPDDGNPEACIQYMREVARAARAFEAR